MSVIAGFSSPIADTPLAAKIFEPGFVTFRRLVIRWESHVENFVGMLRLGCMQILLRDF